MLCKRCLRVIHPGPCWPPPMELMTPSPSPEDRKSWRQPDEPMVPKGVAEWLEREYEK